MAEVIDFMEIGGGRGIRTLDRALQPYNGLANLDHSPASIAGIARKAQETAKICARITRNMRKHQRSSVSQKGSQRRAVLNTVREMIDGR